MGRLVNFPIEGGGNVIVEVDEKREGPALAAAPGDITEQAKMTFNQAAAKLRPIAMTILAQVQDLGPQEVTVELGIKFAAEAGIIVAKTSGEGTCKVSLKWQR